MKEDEKKKKELATIEKVKTSTETKISELKAVISQQVAAHDRQLTQLKLHSGQVQNLKNKLKDNDDQLQNGNLCLRESDQEVRRGK